MEQEHSVIQLLAAILVDTSYYIQYHNADNMGYFPDTESKDVESVSFDTSLRDNFSIFTTKKFIEKASGDNCFLIVGTGTKKKKYYLWSLFLIDKVENEDNIFTAYGTGFNFPKPIFLNDKPDFETFRNYCGNFGIGFQNITKHPFCKTLISFSENIHVSIDTEKQRADLNQALNDLNIEMQKVEPKKRFAEIEQTLRRDRKIVNLLKQTANFKCQFPDCTSQILTKAGLNYVEVAHIKPVSKGGQSILGNLLVLCPNHHKEFDYGDLDIIEQTENKLKGLLNGKLFEIETTKNGC